MLIIVSELYVGNYMYPQHNFGKDILEEEDYSLKQNLAPNLTLATRSSIYVRYIVYSRLICTFKADRLQINLSYL